MFLHMNGNLGAVAHVANDTAWVPLASVIVLGECKLSLDGVCLIQRHLEATRLKVLLQHTETLNLGRGLLKVPRQTELERTVIAIGWLADVCFELHEELLRGNVSLLS